MRRIFPLKSASAGGSNQQHGLDRAAPPPVPQKENPYARLKGTTVASRYAPELSKKGPANRSRRTDSSPSSSEDVSLTNLRAGGASSRREHWCPACPAAAENCARCDTPPSGDENIESKEVEKAVISCPTEDPRQVRSRNSSADLDSKSREKLDRDGSLDSVSSGVIRGNERVPSVNKYSSKRSGLGVVDNLVHERLNSKPPVVKTKAATNAPTPKHTAPESPRSTSAPKGRLTSSRTLSHTSETPRMQSMRILKVPDRVYEATSQSSSDSTRVSDASSSTESPTPRSSSRVGLTHPPPVRTHSRALSFTEGLSSGGKPPISSPSLGQRKLLDSPRTPRKELGSSAIPSVAELVSKGQQANKYSGARVVAERLAKAFRGSNKAKDGKPGSLEMERKTKLGQSKRVPAEEVADSSYDGSCSDTSSLQTGDDARSFSNLLQLERRGDVQHSQHSRMNSADSTRAENPLSWQEFVTEGRVPQGLLNDHPTPEKTPDSSQNSKNSGSTTGSRRWVSPNEGNESPVHKLQYSPSRQEKEREILKGWLEGLKRQSEGITDDLEMKSRMAEQRISVLNGEQSFESPDFLHELRSLDEDGSTNIAAGINIMQQRIRRMHEEKKRLALEVASEVKRRITERAAAKEVLVMMKREMEACVRVMEKEKLGVQAGFERELDRRENEWQKKLENIKLEEKWLRDRVRRLEEEKVGLQSDLAAVTLKEDSLREKVREFELQMEGHRRRVEGAEKTILDLRQSLLSSCQQARQAESELENVKRAYLEKERQSEELAQEVGRLQQLCTDHESSIEGLQQGLKAEVKCATESTERSPDTFRMELVRLSTVEKTLRHELEALRNEMVPLQSVNKDLVQKLGNTRVNTEVVGCDHNLQSELVNLQLRITELQEENNVLSTNLQLAEKERDSGRDLLKSLESNLSGLGEDSKALQDEVGRERNKGHEKEREIQRLERRVEGLLKNNQMLQGILAMREKAALISDEEAREKEKAVREAHQLEAEMRDSLQVTARQLSFMNERAELMSEKLKERDTQLMALKNESGKKDEDIRVLEQNLNDLALSVDAQNRRIMQLTSKNGELARHLQARGKEVEGLHSKVVEDSLSRLGSNQEMDQISVQAYDVKQELEAQNLLCKLLRDKLAQKEDEVSKRCEEVAGLMRSRDWFQAELQRAQNALGEASQRLATLELTVKQKEDLLSSWKAEKQGLLKDISNLKEALPQVEHERDEMRVEADEIGREALRLSAEVEVLRRKVAQLEEDVLLKEGQMSILRGSCFGASE